MTTDAEREAFEAWVRGWVNENPSPRGPFIWDAWQARAALPAPKPEPMPDDLVERLGDMAPEADDMPRTRDVMLKAAARITSDAAVIAAKDAELATLQWERNVREVEIKRLRNYCGAAARSKGTA